MSQRGAMSGTAAWLAAARPHTLSASVVPVLVGTALARAHGPLSWRLFALTLAGTLLVQIGANLTDEAADHAATGSALKYPAPHKVIARGLLSPMEVRIGAGLCFALASGIGLLLVARAGWPLLVLCLASLVVAYGYSAGPFSFGDYAMGEALVFAFMGPAIVGGAYFVQRLELTWPVLLHSLPVAALVTAILVANNLRDREEDALHGRRTLVTLHGDRALRYGYLALVLIAFASPFAAILLRLGGPLLALPWLTIPLAARVLNWVLSAQDRATLHRALRATSALHLAFGLLLAMAIALDPLSRM
jgi:1,4-dihydroxy-2-naphthoate octaprenyltransferase